MNVKSLLLLVLLLFVMLASVDSLPKRGRGRGRGRGRPRARGRGRGHPKRGRGRGRGQGKRHKHTTTTTTGQGPPSIFLSLPGEDPIPIPLISGGGQAQENIVPVTIEVASHDNPTAGSDARQSKNLNKETQKDDAFELPDLESFDVANTLSSFDDTSSSSLGNFPAKGSSPSSSSSAFKSPSSAALPPSSSAGAGFPDSFSSAFSGGFFTDGELDARFPQFPDLSSAFEAGLRSRRRSGGSRRQARSHNIEAVKTQEVAVAQERTDDEELPATITPLYDTGSHVTTPPPPIDHSAISRYYENGYPTDAGDSVETTPAYEYGYLISAAAATGTGDGPLYQQQQKADGELTHGRYAVQLPDGRTQVVTYSAGGKQGYVANVSYIGVSDTAITYGY